MLTSLILLNLAGGRSVDDLKILNADPGFCEILRKAELQGLKRKERRELEKRWCKEKKRCVPSPSAIFRYLSGFHNDEQEKIRALRVFKEALTCLPENVETVSLRSDTAGYQQELLKYCEMGMDKRFGRIEFAIGCDVTNSFKQAVDLGAKCLQNICIQHLDERQSAGHFL